MGHRFGQGGIRGLITNTEVPFFRIMLEEAGQAYQIFTDHGPLELLRSVSRYTNRQYFYRRYGYEFNKTGTTILDEDWDNLIILDACRYDSFSEYNTLKGMLESRVSRGSTSKQFIWGNFANRSALDTVYISDNPWYGKLCERINAELHDFSFCERDAFDGIVSYPSTVTDSAIDFADNYPRKRLIVHYMQPHAPYFDTNGEEVCRWPENPGPKTVRTAYTNNLKLVLEEVDRLVDQLVGKTVISADHGELLGERLLPIPLRQYQHPRGIYVEELVKVPWFVIDGGERKEIERAPRSQRGPLDESLTQDINDQLAGLGYL